MSVWQITLLQQWICNEHISEDFHPQTIIIVLTGRMHCCKLMTMIFPFSKIYILRPPEKAAGVMYLMTVSFIYLSHFSTSHQFISLPFHSLSHSYSPGALRCTSHFHTCREKPLFTVQRIISRLCPLHERY